MRIYKLIIFSILVFQGQGQSLGGNAVFSFLNQPNSSQSSALGGISISNLNKDVGLSYCNPALLRAELDGQINTSFNNYLSGIKNINFNTANYLSQYHITVGTFVNYLHYGNFTETDPAGNIVGEYKASDYVIQLAACKKYKENWYLGTALKFVESNYGQYKSSGLAVDLALNFCDTGNLFQVAFVVKNMGKQLKAYSNNQNEELPFDVQLGITKKLSKAPLQFSLTGHHLHQKNILYNDTTFNIMEGNENVKNSNLTLNQVFSHLIFSAQLFLNEKIELTGGYNFMRRNDLNVYNAANGLNGFSFGIGVLLKKLHFRFSSGFYQKNMYQHIGINFSLKDKI